MGFLSIGVIVPVGAAEAAPPKIFFERVTGAESPVSLVVAGDSEISSNVREAFAQAGARIHLSRAARGQRMREAASSSSAEISLFLFLHTDTLLPSGWDRAVRAAIAAGAAGGAFRLGFSGGGWRMSWVAGWANLRNRITRMPYGDQAPFVRRDVYERLGGHRPWPLLEDWDLARRLRNEEGRARIALLSQAVQTSPRRYLEKGVTKTVMRNWEILRKVKRGAKPDELARLYRS